MKLLRLLLVAASVLLCGLAAAADMSREEQMQALQRAHRAVVGVQALAVDGARSASTLGRARAGSGVLIDPDGLVLTIGYLILEADQVRLVLGDDRSVPARVVAYDPATGFGLLRSLAPLRLEPVPLGHSGELAQRETLMIASGGDSGGVSVAQLVSQRAFSGYWEYYIEQALFTTPPRTDHSGAALFNVRGELVGIGSLVMSDVEPPGLPLVPGNMFVPVDLLAPILAELRDRGTFATSRRAWIGLNCDERNGEVRVLRVNDDSPAEIAGVRPGDRIVRIDGVEVGALETLWKQLWSGAPERAVTLDVRRDGAEQRFELQSVDRMKTLKAAKGI